MKNKAMPAVSAKAQPAKEEFTLFSPEKAPEFSVVMGMKERELVYLGKDKAKAQRILTSLNMHEKFIENGKSDLVLMSDVIKYIKEGKTKSALSHLECIMDAQKQLLKQAEQK